jgi:hypothetical protein
VSAWTISYLPWAKEKHPTVDHGRALGGEASSNYLTNEIQDAFRLQSVKVNDKHIKVVVRQTLQKAEILVGRLIPAGAVGDCRRSRSADSLDHRRGEGGGVTVSSTSGNGMAGGAKVPPPFFCLRNVNYNNIMVPSANCHDRA